MAQVALNQKNHDPKGNPDHPEAYRKRIEELEAQLAAEKAKQSKVVYLKVSEKGGASLYGIRRFPITFYVEEWNRILDMEPEIRAFLKEHDGELTHKPSNGAS